MGTGKKKRGYTSLAYAGLDRGDSPASRSHRRATGRCGQGGGEGRLAPPVDIHLFFRMCRCSYSLGVWSTFQTLPDGISCKTTGNCVCGACSRNQSPPPQVREQEGESIFASPSHHPVSVWPDFRDLLFSLSLIVSKFNILVSQDDRPWLIHTLAYIPRHHPKLVVL